MKIKVCIVLIILVSVSKSFSMIDPNRVNYFGGLGIGYSTNQKQHSIYVGAKPIPLWDDGYSSLQSQMNFLNFEWIIDDKSVVSG